MCGIMWAYDREIPIDWETYNYFMNHPLPFGWMILRAPQNLKEKSK